MELRNIVCAAILMLSVSKTYSMHQILEAVKSGKVDLVQTLIDNEADVNTKDKDGSTALHRAAQMGNLEMVQLLAVYGADINAQNKAGFTAVNLAAQNSHQGVSEWLLENGADISSNVVIHKKVLKKKLTILDIVSFFEAVKAGNILLVQNLIDDGINVNVLDEHNYTALHYAAINNDVKMAESLVNGGIGIDQKNNLGNTALHKAVESGFLEVAQWLIAHGARINIQNSDGKTPLHFAVALTQCGGLEITKMLINCGADIDIQTREGKRVDYFICDKEIKEYIALAHQVKTNPTKELLNQVIIEGQLGLVRTMVKSLKIYPANQTIELAQDLFQATGDVVYSDIAKALLVYKKLWNQIAISQELQYALPEEVLDHIARFV